jgi:hypothetical protein
MRSERLTRIPLGSGQAHPLHGDAIMPIAADFESDKHAPHWPSATSAIRHGEKKAGARVSRPTPGLGEADRLEGPVGMVRFQALQPETTVEQCDERPVRAGQHAGSTMAGETHTSQPKRRLPARPG